MNEDLESKSENTAGCWTLRDLIDLEVLHAQDEKARSSGADALRSRDESLSAQFLAESAPQQPASPERSRLFRFWVQKRRAAEFGDEPSPGEQVESMLRWIGFALLLVGFIFARGAVYSFFRARESLEQRAEPINVFWYAVVCIGVPLLFTLCAFWLLLGMRAVPSLPRAPAFIRGLLLSLLHPVFMRVMRKISDLSGPEKRLSAQALWGAFRRRALDRKGAIALQLTSLGQLFGLGFTAGVLLFSWTDSMFYSRVFGWQSTNFSVTPEAAYRIIRITSSPWAWLAGQGTGFPSLQQVAATRFVRYQDPSRFPPEAASAWANYLIAAALIYGFFPRALLCYLSRRELRRAMENPDFSQARFDRLWERLTIPRVSMQTPHSGVEPALPVFPRIPPKGGGVEAKSIVIVPEELNSEARRAAIVQWLAATKQWSTEGVLPLAPEPGSIEAAVKELSRAHQERAVSRAVLIQESFMPPVKSVLKLLVQIRAAMNTGGVAVGLLGKPSDLPLGEPPSKTDLAVWEAKVLSLGDSGTDVFSFQEPV